MGRRAHGTVSYTHLDVYKRQLLERAGDEMRVLNTINFKKSMRYNPFAYIHSEKDILKLVTCLITNTTGQEMCIRDRPEGR